MPKLSHRRLASAGLLSAALLPVIVGSAPAAPSAVIPLNSGLTTPAGIVETPDGATWISDELRGVCRVDPAERPALVEDELCGEQHAGPDKALGMAFDATTGSLYVADGASGAGAVWRLRWDAGSGRLEGGTQIVRLPGDRVNAVALVPSASGAGAPDLVYVTKESDALMRVDAPASASPEPPERIGTAPGADASAMTFLADHLYVAAGGAVSRLELGAGGAGPASSVPGLDGIGASALAADPARHRLYAGTTNGTLDDDVHVLDARRGTVEAYERGFAGVTGLAVTASGDVLVADDPAEAAGVLDAEGQGRLWRIGLQPLDRPAARIESGPPPAGRETSVTFAYAARDGAGFECRLDGAAWEPCPGTGSGSIAYDDLADGRHRFEVRAVDGDETIGTGVPAWRSFVVDTRAPLVTVSSEAGNRVTGTRLPLDLVADESPVAFSCSVDRGPYWACDSSTVLTGLEPGRHVVHALGVDAAGNPSDAGEQSSWFEFEMLPAPVAREPQPAPTTSAPQSPAPQPAAPRPPTRLVVSAGASAARPGLRPFRLSPVRLTAPARGRRAAALRLTLRAPAGARVARVVVVGPSEHGAREIAMRHIGVRPGATNRLTVQLTAAESRRLRPELYLVTVALGSSREHMGNTQAHWLRVRPR